jgi:DNA-binding transcriptional LysR family regulator
MFREGYDMREVTLAACRRERIEPRVAVEGGELDAVLGFVEAGLGIAVVPSMVIENRPRLRRIPFKSPGLSRTIAFAHRRDVEPSASARAFRTVMLEHLGDAARSRALPAGVEIVGNARRRPRDTEPRKAARR